MNLDERDLIINKGTWAEGLRNDETFQTCIKELLEEKFAQFCYTDSQGADEREALYFVMRGIQEFEGCLNGMVQNMKITLQQEERNNERREV